LLTLDYLEFDLEEFRRLGPEVEGCEDIPKANDPEEARPLNDKQPVEENPVGKWILTEGIDEAHIEGMASKSYMEKYRELPTFLVKDTRTIEAFVRNPRLLIPAEQSNK
jgi:hypothetical protein